MKNPFLTRNELKRITCRQRRSCVVRELEGMGCRFRTRLTDRQGFLLDAEGWPLLPRAAVYGHVDIQPEIEPDYSKLQS